MLTRLAGLIRQSVFAHYLGTSGAADAFNVAVRIPLLLQNLMGEGVLSGTLLPVYARLMGRGEEKAADRVAGVFVSFLAVAVAAVVIAGCVFTPAIVKATAGGLEPAVMTLAITLTRIMFPGVGLLVLYGWALAILNAHRQFFVSHVAPVLWNAAMIATLLIFGLRMTGAPLATALAWGSLAGSALQFGIEIPFVLRHARHLSLGFDRSLEGVRTVFRNLLPVVGGRAVVQLSGYVEIFMASLLPTGAVSILAYAQSIYFVPVSVFAMSITVAELPRMASETGSEEEVNGALRRRLDVSMRQVAFFIIPAVVAFVMIGRPIVSAVFERGQFTPAMTATVWYTLAGASVGMYFVTLGRLYISAFYALHDTRTPLRIAIIRVAVGAALAFLLAFPLRPLLVQVIGAAGLPPLPVPAMMGVAALTMASSIAAWIQYALLRSRMRRRIGAGPSKRGHFVKLMIAALAAGGTALAVYLLVAKPLLAAVPFRSVVEAVVACGVFGGVYLAATAAMEIPELRALRRFGRG